MVDTTSRPQLIEYPESDGQPMSESDATRNYLIYCVGALRLFFQSRPQVYVSGNLFIYYEEGQTEKSISPDVFVIFGVSKRERRSYKTWQEGGKLPAFVLEITSASTKKIDEEVKPRLYESLGIQEYFQYDPTGDYLRPQLKGQRLIDQRYQPIAPQTLTDGSISFHSNTLGLDLRLLPAMWVGELRPATRQLALVDPITETKLLNLAETEQERQNAFQRAEQEAQRAEQEAHRAEQESQRAEQESQRAEQESQRAEQAEQHLQTLLDRLRSQGIDPADYGF
jgi:Uma2 family endonuclease